MCELLVALQVGVLGLGREKDFFVGLELALKLARTICLIILALTNFIDISVELVACPFRMNRGK
jgi:hypothetical protein